MKGIVITEKNRAFIAARFHIEDFDIPTVLPIGMILVTDFGNDETFEVVTQEVFDATYTRFDDLDNEFFEVEKTV